jgi:flagellar FliL protein
MAEEEAKKETNQGKSKKGINFKVILVGLPLFVIQLVLVYFITANFLVKTTLDTEPAENSNVANENLDENSEESESTTQQIFNIEDLIINPAGTSGQRLLLMSIGFGVSDEEKLNLLRENEVVIKDMVINTVSQKSLATLSKIELKDSLKVELAEKINSSFPQADIKNVYFSKYLIN